MQFSEILGQEHIKSHLTKVPIWVESRTQLFVGPEGAVRYHGDAYAQYILCGNQNGENKVTNQSCNLKFKNITS
jgi:DNA polymerase-3 subunit delta'